MTNNDNEETRSYTELKQELRRVQADNKMMRTNIAQLRQTIKSYERADAVVQAIAANNDVLSSVESSTYQVQGKEVDEFGRFMFELGASWISIINHDHRPVDRAFNEAIAAWKQSRSVV